MKSTTITRAKIHISVHPPIIRNYSPKMPKCAVNSGGRGGTSAGFREVAHCESSSVPVVHELYCIWNLLLIRNLHSFCFIPFHYDSNPLPHLAISSFSYEDSTRRPHERQLKTASELVRGRVLHWQSFGPQRGRVGFDLNQELCA